MTATARRSSCKISGSTRTSASVKCFLAVTRISLPPQSIDLRMSSIIVSTATLSNGLFFGGRFVPSPTCTAYCTCALSLVMVLSRSSTRPVNGCARLFSNAPVIFLAAALSRSVQCGSAPIRGRPGRPSWGGMGSKKVCTPAMKACDSSSARNSWTAATGR